MNSLRRLTTAISVCTLVLAAGVSAQISNIPTRGTEDAGRTYVGEPVSPFIGHLTLLFVTGKNPTPGAGSMQDTVDWGNNPLHSCVADGTGALVVYAHPDAADRVLLLNHLTGMDVFHEDEIPSVYPYRDQMWDAVNTSLDAQGRPLLWGFAADDSHSTQPGAFNYARNVSLVPSADVYSIKAALRSGAFYTTNGPGVDAVSVSGTRITVTASQSSTILWLRAGQYNSGSSFVQTTAIGSGRALHIDSAVTTSTLDIAQLGLALADLHFVRAIVQTSSTTYALTQPFRVSADGAISNPYPAGGIWVAGQSHNHDDAWIGGGPSRLITFRSNYLAVGQQAPFETAYSYWEYPFQGLDSDGYPDVKAVSPAKVPHAALPRITLTGVNFTSGLTVQAGDYVLSDVAVLSPTQLSATVPLSVPPGAYDLVVTNPNALRGTAAGALVVQEPTADDTGWASYQSPDLPWNQATSIEAVGDDMWVGTMQGAARYARGAWSSYIPTGGQNVWAQGIYDVIAEPAGGIWFSSEGMWYQGASGTFPWAYSRPTNGATSERWGRMAFDASGRLWATSRAGEGLAVRSTSGTWTRWTRASSGMPLDDAQTIARDSQGNMWVGFNGGYGVWKWTGSSWQQVAIPSLLNHAPDPLVVRAGQGGDMWVAVAPRNMSYTPTQSGAVRFRVDGSYDIYQSPPLPQPRLTDILAARNGDVWFASRGGVARLDRLGEWTTFTSANSGLVSDVVMAMAEDSTGRIWFATANGVSSYTPVHPSAPAAPTGLTATARSASGIALAWTDNSADETGFQIERSADGVTFVQAATVGANATSYVDSGLAASTTYAYRVRAYNSGGASAYSNTASATTLAAPPAAPTGLSATATSATAISLAWVDNSADETGFRIERSADGITFAEIAIVAANVTAYADSGLAAATTYAYRVRAYNSGGLSAYSNTASATTLPAAPSAPVAPTGLTAHVSGTQVSLNWIDNSSNESGFQIERATGSGAFALLATVGANVTTYVDTGLPKTSYRYRVRAYNDVGTSAYSNTVSVKTKPR